MHVLPMALDPEVAEVDAMRGHPFQMTDDAIAMALPPGTLLRMFPDPDDLTPDLLGDLPVAAVYYLGDPEVCSWLVVEVDPETWQGIAIVLTPVSVQVERVDLLDMATNLGAAFAGNDDGMQPVTDFVPVSRMVDFRPKMIRDFGNEAE